MRTVSTVPDKLSGIVRRFWACKEEGHPKRVSTYHKRSGEEESDISKEEYHFIKGRTAIHSRFSHPTKYSLKISALRTKYLVDSAKYASRDMTQKIPEFIGFSWLAQLTEFHNAVERNQTR
jgi:hypothetical protein